MLVYYQFNTCSALYHHLLSRSQPFFVFSLKKIQLHVYNEPTLYQPIFSYATVVIHYVWFVLCFVLLVVC